MRIDGAVVRNAFNLAASSVYAGEGTIVEDQIVAAILAFDEIHPDIRKAAAVQADVVIAAVTGIDVPFVRRRRIARGGHAVIAVFEGHPAVFMRTDKHNESTPFGVFSVECVGGIPLLEYRLSILLVGDCFLVNQPDGIPFVSLFRIELVEAEAQRKAALVEIERAGIGHTDAIARGDLVAGELEAAVRVRRQRGSDRFAVRCHIIVGAPVRHHSRAGGRLRRVCGLSGKHAARHCHEHAAG